MKKYNAVSFDKVNITGGFWEKRQRINRAVTAQAVYDRFSDTHRFAALECNWEEGMPDEPHVFWDSDVAKWIEGAAYIISKEKNGHLEKLCDHAIDLISENQTEEGYFNSHFLVTEQDKRYKDRNKHELYCAGHLMEAACAYYKATGKDKFLKTMCRFADYIYDTFYIYKTPSFVTGGHPEIELALVKLYNTTGNEKYLELSKFFVDMRGNNDKDLSVAPEWARKNYDQSHIPLKEQTEAEGHSVRALYIYSAMADIAEKFSDEEYLSACETLFSNIVNKRMYVTGGLGSSHIGEAFTIDYDLPNKTAYAETCAAIAMSFFCERMQKLKASSAFADAAERVMYNGALSGVSLDGKSFFYENPLEIDPYFAEVNTSTLNKQHMPIMERLEVFGCSCCPPNILRYIASIGNLFYTYDEETLFVHQYAESCSEINGTIVFQQTDYPSNGKIKLKIEGNTFKKIAVRVPGWCGEYEISEKYEMKDGYAYMDIPANGEISLDFKMPVVLMESNARVQENAGRVAVTRGPLVYCLEGVDNGELLRSMWINYDSKFTAEYEEEFGAPVLYADGYKKDCGTALYCPAQNNFSEKKLKFIPYFAFANRGATEMTVWVAVK